MVVVVPEDPGGFARVAPSPAPPDAAAGPGDTTPLGDATPAGDATLSGGPAPAPPTWHQGSPGTDPGRRTRRASDPLPAVIGGLVLVAIGAYVLVRDWITVDWGVVGAAGLVALGVVVILAALRPRH
jgi:hypothetical protein